MLVYGGVMAVLIFGVAPAVWAGTVDSAQRGADATSSAVEVIETTPRPTTASTPEPTATPVTVVRTEQTRRALGFTTRNVDDARRAVGTKAVTQAGVAGREVTTVEVTLVDGVEKSRRVLSVITEVKPVERIVSVGTKQPDPAPVAPAPQAAAGGCDTNYSGACVPIASDVDCAGGSGNGPAYVQGPVTVVGSDIYGLDRDGDGVGCES
ncbi:G5 domain-containing protein [Frondihabitans sp. 762G35]|uniref:G5 domain-containing protein n=1 Tax=Frondihabitans sp. 762G35 TaxID=1446794 RepID=UPI001F25912C|nr:G5 domain-containing protein [Frondihabitans sp. 762G35]